MASIAFTGLACTTCALVLTNDEPDTTEHAAAMDKALGALPNGSVVIDSDVHEDFSTAPCDTCGDTLTGERFGVVVLSSKFHR